MERLNYLCALEIGWDGYQGVPVNFETANFAVEMLRRVCPPNSDVPQIVPGSNGDLQLEWHNIDGSIELHVKAPLRVHAWRSVDGIDEEIEVTNDFTVVAQWLAAIPEQNVAAVAAPH